MGKYHILREVANGVIDEKGLFFPYKIRTAAATGTIISCLPNERLFIKNILISSYKAGASAAGLDTVTLTIAGISTVIVTIGLCETFAASGSSVAENFDLNILGDRGASLTCTEGTATQIKVIYASINESEGEYDG